MPTTHDVSPIEWAIFVAVALPCAWLAMLVSVRSMRARYRRHRLERRLAETQAPRFDEARRRRDD